MGRIPHPLDGIQIASPCSASWDAMAGDDRVRFCRQCRLRVYNLSEMSRREAEALIRKKEGRLCVRFYRRADGTILTEDCPVGAVAACWRAARVVWGAAALLAVLFLSAAASGLSRREPIVTSARLRRVEPFATALRWLDPFVAPPNPPASAGSSCAGDENGEVVDVVMGDVIR